MSDSIKSDEIDIELIRALAQIVEDSNLSELEIEQGEARIYLGRQLTVAPAPVAAAPAPAPQSAAPAPAAGSSETKPGYNEEDLVKSPMVGTAYLASEPGAPNLVSEGDQVKAGDTLLIVEAMKVMNPILAPHSGTVTQIFVENEQPVEFDQPLVLID